MLVFAILEDDPARRQAFERVSRTLGAQVAFFDNASDFQAWVRSSLASASLISLDGDLFGSPKPDPGSGLDAAHFLASVQATSAPVIVHSVNRGLARKMVELLHRTQWKVIRVDPAPGDDPDLPVDPTEWIEKYLMECARELTSEATHESPWELAGIRVVHGLVVLLFLGIAGWLYLAGMNFALNAWGLIGGTTTVLLTSVLMVRAASTSSSRRIRVKGFLQALVGIGLIAALWTWFVLHHRTMP